jgi:EpsD family peptidyl-prolyl cis-trans isomerase
MKLRPAAVNPLACRGVAALAAAAAVLTLAGCGAEGPTPDSQVAARVNKGEISVHQVQAVLTRQPRLMAEQPEAAAAKVLDVLVDQELAAQAAVDQGLERDPAVVQALQLAHREVLARAYQDQLGNKAALPSSDEIDAYYSSRPEVFAQRRLYSLQEFQIDSTSAQSEQLAELAHRARNADELGALLRDAGLRHKTRRFVQAAEDVPLAMLGPLSKLERGQSLWAPQAASPRIYTVLDVQSAPVDRRAAAPAIAAYLAGERKRQIVQPAMKSLRDAAQIHYQGAFAKAGELASAPSGAAAPVTR